MEDPEKKIREKNQERNEAIQAEQDRDQQSNIIKESSANVCNESKGIGITDLTAHNDANTNVARETMENNIEVTIGDVVDDENAKASFL